MYLADEIFRLPAFDSCAQIVYFRYAPDSPYEPGEHLLRLLTIPGLELISKFTVADRERVRQRPLERALP